MRRYVISIKDDAKINQLLALLNDLSYVEILEQTSNEPEKRFPLMDTPFPVKNFKLFSREELHER